MSALLALRARLRFALWALRLRAECRRRGARLVLRGRARFDGPPHLRVLPEGSGGATLTLVLGEGVRLGRDTVLEVWAGADNALELGDGVYFQHGVRVQLRGGRVALGAHTHVRDGTLLRSGGELVLGREVTVGFHVMLAAHERISVGDHVALGARVSVMDSDHDHDGSLTPWTQQPLRVEPVTIGANAIVGDGAVVLRGARVGAAALIGANAVVLRGEHAGAHVHAGIPARPVKPV